MWLAWQIPNFYSAVGNYLASVSCQVCLQTWAVLYLHYMVQVPGLPLLQSASLSGGICLGLAFQCKLFFWQFSNSSLGRSSSSIWGAGVRSESWLPTVFLVRLYDPLPHGWEWTQSFRLLRRLASAVTTWGTKVVRAWPSNTKWGIKLQKLDNKSSQTGSHALFLTPANEDLTKLGWDVAYLIAWLAWIWSPVWHKPAMVVHTYDPKTWEVEAEGPEV